MPNKVSKVVKGLHICVYPLVIKHENGTSMKTRYTYHKSKWQNELKLVDFPLPHLITTEYITYLWAILGLLQSQPITQSR
jgi:hypothetical protein